MAVKPKKQGPKPTSTPNYQPIKKTPVAPVKNIYPNPSPLFPKKPSKKPGQKQATI